MGNRIDPTVYAVGADASVEQMLSDFARTIGAATHIYASAEAFLVDYDDRPGCLVAGCSEDGQEGLALQAELKRRGFAISLIFVAANASTSMTVQAVKNGAVTVLDNTCTSEELERAIRDGLTLDRQRREIQSERLQILQRIDSLASREVEVLKLLVEGYANKEMAAKLNVSLRTIENRRRQIFSKVGVKSVAELVRAVIASRTDRPHLLQPPTSAMERESFHDSEE